MSKQLILKADAGATFVLTLDGDDETIVLASTRLVDFTNPEGLTTLKITGKRRWHTRLGNGHRAVLTLDTGEGLEKIGGVLLTPTPFG